MYRSIRSQVVTDSHKRPVAVVVPYEDWLELMRQLDLQPPASSVDALLDATAGLWTGGDGLAFQEALRHEWDRPTASATGS